MTLFNSVSFFVLSSCVSLDKIYIFSNTRHHRVLFNYGNRIVNCCDKFYNDNVKI